MMSLAARAWPVLGEESGRLGPPGLQRAVLQVEAGDAARQAGQLLQGPLTHPPSCSTLLLVNRLPPFLLPFLVP
jgi:hypothetical protein